MSWSLHHAASQLAHEFGRVALNILRYLVRMQTGLLQFVCRLDCCSSCADWTVAVHVQTGLFQCSKIQALSDMTPFLLLNSAFESSLLPPCARFKQPCLGLLRLKMDAARCSVL
jgi:hypothetical protein